MESGNKFTDNARMALKGAEALALLCQSSSVETSHLLLAIATQGSSIGARALRKVGVDIDKLKEYVGLKQGVVYSDGSTGSVRYSDAMRLVVRVALSIADDDSFGQCGTAHLMISMLNQYGSQAVQMIKEQNIDRADVIEAVSEQLDFRRNWKIHRMPFGKAASEAFNMDNGLDGLGDDVDENEMLHMDSSRPRRRGSSILTTYARDLVREAQDGNLDPVIGREREIDRLITIISRRTKNNPVLIGEAGVGKTAVVEGLASRITSGMVPSFLRDRRIMEVDLAAMVAGTKYRGEFEDRLKKLINEVEKDDKIIVFIDEVHSLVGAGSAEGSMDAANLLKPALARGKFHLIGATTTDEYRKNIEKDAALNRRLQSVMVESPSESDTIRILTGLVPKYEEFHHVRISEPVIKEVVRLSERYLTERQQPDKAIDVLDETAARVHATNANSDLTREIQKLEDELLVLASDIERAAAEEDYERAALSKMRQSQIKEKLDDLKSKESDPGYIAVKINDVATTVSKMTGVPLEQLKRSEMTKLANLEKNLSRRIVGQSQAVTVVAQAIRRSRAGIADPRRPIGSFIFLGPTGVGKTELAKVLAEEVFGSHDSLIKVDMSEFSERHTVARLVGAPAGYVGYDDGGQLTEKIRRQPYSVVLFDEIEKAHPDVFNILLQILEDGVLTDGHGKQVDFRNCVIILTSNIGAADMVNDVVGFAIGGDEQAQSADDDNRREMVMKTLRNTMRPELLNRFDQIVMFNSLSDREMGQILEIMLEQLNDRLMDRGVVLTVSAKLKHWLAKKGYDRRYGARPLRRVLQDELERVIADQLIVGKIKRGDIIKADLRNDQIVITQQTETGRALKSKKPAKV